MAMKVLLSDCGNPDHGQNAETSVTGLRPRKVEVKDFEEASKACRAYIEKHDLGMGNWNGGTIFEGDRKIAEVSYNGRVWRLPKRMNDDPLWPLPKGPAPAADPTAWESAVLDVPGHGRIAVSGCFRLGTVSSVSGEFRLSGGSVEFMEYVGFSREDGAGQVAPFNAHPDGVWERYVGVPATTLDAINTAISDWYAGDGAAMILRNELKDRQKDLLVQERNIGLAEAEIAAKREKAEATRLRIESLEAEIAATASPGPQV